MLEAPSTNREAGQQFESPKPSGESEDQKPKNVLTSIDMHAQNAARLESLRSSAQKVMDRRTADNSLLQQVARGETPKGKKWTPVQLENGDISLRAQGDRENPGGYAVLVQSETNFNASLEAQRQEIAKLYNENVNIEQQVGGPEKLAEMQKKADRVKTIEQELETTKTRLQEELRTAEEILKGIGNRAGEYVQGKETPQFKQDKEQTRTRLTKEKLLAEEKLKQFYDKTRPALTTERDRLVGEIKQLTGK